MTTRSPAEKASPVLRRPCTPSAASPSARARSRIANTLPRVLGGSLHLGHLTTESLVEVSGRAPRRGPTVIPQTMRAAVIFGPDVIGVVEKPVPRPGPGEVLLRVEAAS